MDSFYWELITRDDVRYDIPPAAVDVVKRRMDNHDPINLSTATVPYAEIKHFRITNKPYGQPLLEAAAQAFDEPMTNPDGSTIVKWVKKRVTQREYAKTYSQIPAYRKLGDENGLVMIAFRLPIHQIDINIVSPCTPDEQQQLTSRQ